MPKVDVLRRMIADAESIVAFTGAGISTESGIPDFRSPGGIWTKNKPIEFGDFLASAEMRRESWRRKFATHETLQKATPNAGHRALARLVELGKMPAVITQNIDGLHQASGVPGEKVIELHGNTTYAACLDCGQAQRIAPCHRQSRADRSGRLGRPRDQRGDWGYDEPGSRCELTAWWGDAQWPRSKQKREWR
jgi:NAD-dependent deacetylase